MMTNYQVGTTFLPANAPNLVLAGAAETLYGTNFIYGEWLLVQFPVLGLLKAIAIIILVCWLFPRKPARPKRRPPASRSVRRSGG